MTKVLHITPSLMLGGIETFIPELTSRISPEFEHYVWYADGFDETLAKTYREKNIRSIVKKPLPSGKTAGLFTAVRFFYRELRHSDFHLIHCHQRFFVFVIGIAVLLIPGKKVIATIHSPMNYSRSKVFLWTLYQNLVGLGIFRYISVCRAVQDSLMVWYRKEVIYNGISTSSFSPQPQSKARLREQILGLTDNDVVFVAVGNLRPNVKGYEYLVPAFEEITKCYRNVYLLIIGNGDPGYLESSKYQISDDSGSRIRFLGKRPDVKNLLHSADIFVCSSVTEGLPISLLEAMSSGLPILATKVGGIPEVVRNGGNARLVEKGSVQELLDGLLFFLKNPNLWNKWGEESRKIILERFDIESTAKQYEHVYQKAIT